ncbi:SRPBCC family protein [Anatilimnocola floriformis]|uniref:SRPBCC family protein n=1 Tax=Anatilimnocola floriformis TaxID=2948575 RepID=UPI0020C2A0A5|nr:SRPBCC family protein [Anatilimnocola floriformis]
MSTLISRTFTVSINRPPAEVETYITDPCNLPKWADGLGSSVRNENGQWIVTTRAGEVSIRFAPPNPFGVIDHWVKLAPEVEIHIPMRVLPSGDGCEVSFTLFRLATMSDEQFADDQQKVERDMQRLQQILNGH